MKQIYFSNFLKPRMSENHTSEICMSQGPGTYVISAYSSFKCEVTLLVLVLDSRGKLLTLICLSAFHARYSFS